MAFETVDFFIRPEDGWVEVGSNYASLLIRPSEFHPWWLAVTSGAAPVTTNARATGNVTFGGLPVAGETVTINGEIYTARAARALPFEFTIGGDAEATADNLLAAINIDGDLDTYFPTDAGVGVVTITATVPGTAGNAITLAEAATNTTVSGALLTGGTTPIIGMPFGRGADNARETYESPTANAGKAYIRTREPSASYTSEKTHFSVIRS